MPRGVTRQVQWTPDQSVDEVSAGMAQRLTAAKPITWRGKGDLLQCAWSLPVHGTWLVIDLWSGISGLLIALLSMGVHFYAVAAECDSNAREAAAACMPNLLHVDDVAKVRAVDFKGLIQKRKPRGILVGGGALVRVTVLSTSEEKGWPILDLYNPKNYVGYWVSSGNSLNVKISMW